MQLWSHEQHTPGSAAADKAIQELLRSWDQREARVAAALAAADPDLGLSKSVLGRAVRATSSTPVGPMRTAVYCTTEQGGDVMHIGVRLSPLSNTGGRPPQDIEVAVVTAEDTYEPTEEFNDSNAALVGSLVMGNARWAQLRNMALTPDCSGIVLPMPIEPTTTA